MGISAGVYVARKGAVAEDGRQNEEIGASGALLPFSQTSVDLASRIGAALHEAHAFLSRQQAFLEAVLTERQRLVDAIDVFEDSSGLGGARATMQRSPSLRRTLACIPE